MARYAVTPETSTVNGYPAAPPVWDGLRLAEAEPRTKSTLMLAAMGPNAPFDLHLSVPWCHPEYEPMSSKDCGRYRVRPKKRIRAAGVVRDGDDWFWVTRKEL